MNVVDLFRAMSIDLGISGKDESYLLDRLRNEGYRFVTVVLPSYAKHILECVELSEWRTFTFSGGVPFKHDRKGLPVFLQGFLLQFFSRTSRDQPWRVRPDLSAIALYQVRQLCEYCYKLCLPFDDGVLIDAERKFVENEKTIRGVDAENSQHVNRMRCNFINHYKTASAVNLEDCANDARPGPGTFSGKWAWEQTHNRKFYHRNYERPEIHQDLKDLSYCLRFNKRSPHPHLSSDDPSYSELLFVPKDSRGPRTIVREPYLKLMFQMGFNTQMATALEYDTRHRVNFVDQKINQQLAYQGSIDKKMSTIDLKDASDRVSYDIVRTLFAHLPLARVLRKLRTDSCLLPSSGTIIPLRKLAGMGSGFTFPCMSLVIHLTICTHVSLRTGTPYRECMRNVYVYGDDIILPTSWFRFALEALDLVGLKVNTNKSFIRSNFRESCGGDYYRGNPVSPVRLKLSNAKVYIHKNALLLEQKANGMPKSKYSSSFFYLGLERHARELVNAQLFNTAEYIYKFLEDALSAFYGVPRDKFRLPLVAENSAVLGRLSKRSDVLDSLEYTPTGKAQNGRYVVPIAQVKDLNDPCPYQHLKRRLMVETTTKWEDNIFPVGRSTDFGFVTEPRSVKLSLRRMSSYSLT